MKSTVVVLEPDPAGDDLWRYGRARRGDELTEFGLLQRADGCVNTVTDDQWPLVSARVTAMCILRLLDEVRRVEYDDSPQYREPRGAPTPPPAQGRLGRSTAGRSKGGGPTLGERYGPKE